ncbi:MAG: dipeptidyl peptidase 3 [Prevotella sp.]|jgi:dipeptidyl-peptidase-3|nr:dipeptidyl peptidase 3 [Prevotella sp.]MCI2102450.1 dipeptidyl peptidase 3 [Prevotella sp.]
MQQDFYYSDERFADLQMLRYRLKGFEELTAQQKIYIYFLAKATLSGRDIATDQMGKYNLRIRKTLEAVYTGYKGSRNDSDYQALEVYLKRVWFSNGIYHHYGCEKFLPDFSQSFLQEVIRQIDPSTLPLRPHETVDDLCHELFPVIFDVNLLPKRVNQADGEDLVVTSACNFYEGVTQQEVEDFYARKKTPNDEASPSWGLNSKVVKVQGEIKELPWIESGLYGRAIQQIVYWLGKAREVAENVQQKNIISLLITYYKTGDLKIFDQYSIEWLKEQEGSVDFINGFIEVYGDPLGLKGSWEGIVEYKDWEATRRTQLICQNAQWFEDHSPVDPQFRKSKVKGVSAHVINAAMLGGDNYPSSAIGINLPNADWIRSRYGSKSVTIGNLIEAYNKAAHGNGFLEEFVLPDQQLLGKIEKYADCCDDLHTDLHECLGHGSGKLLPGTDPDALKAYGSTIEEARADLFGLYYIADPKLVELGLLPDKTAYQAQYDTYMMNGLMTQLVRIKPGHQIEEAHMRNRALIAYWALDLCENHEVEIVKIDGKSYVRIYDYSALRAIFGKELKEIQRVKSEGDYERARYLVEKYAIKVDSCLHQEILVRYEKLNLAPYKGFINPWMKPVYSADHEIADIQLDYTESYAHQMLRYGKEYGWL